MKIAITANGPTLDSVVEARFGRCAYFVVVDLDTMQCEGIPNPNVSLGGGAGIQSATLMADMKVTAVLTGNCGPNAYQVFGAAGIQVLSGVEGVVREAVERFKSGGLTASANPKGSSPYPVGGSAGMGGGRGKGCGRAGGMGSGRRRVTGSGEIPPQRPNADFGGPGSGSTVLPSPVRTETELNGLQQSIIRIRQQLRDIEDKFKRLSEET